MAATALLSTATLPALFAAQAARTPDAVAVVFEDRALSYAALDAHANRLASHLRSLGVGPDVLVGVCAERSVELVVGLLAVLKAGGAYVPLEPEHPAGRLAGMVEDAGLRVVLTQRALAPRLAVPAATHVRAARRGAERRGCTAARQCRPPSLHGARTWPT